MADSTVFDKEEAIFILREDGSFSANSKGIIEKKAEFYDEARKYLLLRKGEDIGAEIIAVMSLFINSLSDVSFLEVAKDFIVYTTVLERIYKYYSGARDRLEKRKATVLPPPKDLRILCWPDKENREAKPIFQAQGYQVKRYENELQKGPLRYYLNEKRYCLFIRSGEDTFTGVIGDNPDTIAELKQTFEKEWSTSKEL